MQGQFYSKAIHASFKLSGLLPDVCQMAVMDRLGQLAAEVCAPEIRRFPWLISRRRVGRGIFLWGGVGRGKTLLLDAMAEVMPEGMVVRYHQHVFLDDFHRVVSMASGEEDRFRKAVLSLVGSARLLVLDEFHAYDIADALILERALGILSDQGVCLALTANHCPWELWPKTAFHAQQARHFDPLADLLRRHCDFIEVDHGLDYRESNSRGVTTRWLVPDSPENRSLAMSLVKNAEFPLSEVRFEFGDMCGGLFRHADYEILCRRLPLLVLNGLPAPGPDDGDALRRLVWLIDAAWEAALPMTVVAEAELDCLFEGIGSGLELLLGNDLKRTVSRLRALVSIEGKDIASI